MKAEQYCARQWRAARRWAAPVHGAQAPGVSDNTVKIGVLTDMSGVFSDLAGAGAVTAAQMAIDDFVEKEKPAVQSRAGLCRSPEQA